MIDVAEARKLTKFYSVWNEIQFFEKCIKERAMSGYDACVCPCMNVMPEHQDLIISYFKNSGFNVSCPSKLIDNRKYFIISW